MLTNEEWKDFNMPSARIETRLKEACSMDLELRLSVSLLDGQSDIYLFG